jgi:hypothetical protein
VTVPVVARGWHISSDQPSPSPKTLHLPHNLRKSKKHLICSVALKITCFDLFPRTGNSKIFTQRILTYKCSKPFIYRLFRTLTLLPLTSILLSPHVIFRLFQALEENADFLVFIRSLCLCCCFNITVLIRLFPISVRQIGIQSLRATFIILPKQGF